MDAYAIGLHRGIYEAVVQVEDVTAIRHYDRKCIFDWFEKYWRCQRTGLQMYWHI